MAKIIPTERLRAPASNMDPVYISEAVDVSSNDYAPSGGHFRALNASVAGKITITKLNGVDVQEYVNTGWNPVAGLAVKHGGSGDTATIIAAAVDA